MWHAGWLGRCKVRRSLLWEFPPLPAGPSLGHPQTAAPGVTPVSPGVPTLQTVLPYSTRELAALSPFFYRDKLRHTEDTDLLRFTHQAGAKPGQKPGSQLPAEDPSPPPQAESGKQMPLV